MAILHTGRFIAAAGAFLLSARLIAADEPPHARWIVGESSAKAGEAATIWLAIQPVANATGITVTFGSPHNATVSVMHPEKKCVEDPTAHTFTCALDAAPVIIQLAVTPRAEGAMSFLAIVTQTGPKLTTAVIDTVASESIAVRPWFDIGPVFTTVLTALAGFMGGLLTQFLVGRIDGARKNKDLIMETEAKLLRTLTPEITRNQADLTNFLATPGAHPPILNVGMYNTMLADASITSYLTEATRRPYLKRITDLYDAIAIYHHAVNQSRPDADIRRFAEAVGGKFPQLQP